MKKVTDIYEEYKIRHDIKGHMIRVAAVASLICDNFTEPVNKERVITACLLHDMGNILKVGFKDYPEFNEPEGEEYWRAVKKEFQEKYGDNEDKATVIMCESLNMPPDYFALLKEVAVGKLENISDRNFELEIVKYSDTRVSPKKILPIKERLEEFAKRYGHGEDKHKATLKVFTDLEERLFAHVHGLKPEDITDESIAPLISELKNFMIKSNNENY